MPSALPASATPTTVLPARLQRRNQSVVQRRRPSRREMRSIRSSATLSVEHRRRALARDIDANCDAGDLDAVVARRRDDRLRERMRRALLQASRDTQDLGTVAGGSASTPATAGLPSVSVPVLSTTVRRVARPARAHAALRMSDASWAPRPVPTMMAVGVASPSAHGQAITSTATALTSATAASPANHHVARRSAARSPPRPERRSPDTRSARRWIGAFEPCASRDQSNDACQQRRARRRRSHRRRSKPSWLTVPAKTACARRSCDRAAFAGEHAFVDASIAPSRTMPSTANALAGPHHEPVARGTTSASGTSASAPSRSTCAAAAGGAAGLPAPPTCRPSRALRAACRAAPA